ncbi:MAG: hypothetical protein A2X25_07875 [Chloroflexi bacterium GWB2_49_20]|nr:MAG: hypothetical protein A2X25_07875 [Chloroflexi bacterium GWB2_49_20]OGN78070.1 MAG: hypothetical protein A2X26_15680 [Chloroflexi bacterium GWC2_49_37]OGN85108.1 MAG: hypothetical protein A2X27_10380 [Chloroflexi bacterium GWD2_49_16]HBG74852.1 hypothetical protein [Anaerolineae bacterium]HCC78422.1 hypothetical protein [Anaerolineae bacterium]
MLLVTTTSPDGSKLQVGISVYNYGQIAGTLSDSDVSLTPEGGSPVAPVLAEPPCRLSSHLARRRPSTLRSHARPQSRQL